MNLGVYGVQSVFFGYSLLINVNLSLYKPHNFREKNREVLALNLTERKQLDLLADREEILFKAYLLH